MADTLSGALASLSTKAKGLEDRIAVSRQDTKQNLDKKAAAAKAALQSAKDQFVRHADALNAKATGDWDAFKGSLNQKVAQVKADMAAQKASLKDKLADKKSQLDLAAATRRYKNAADYTASCIEWASMALDEVESASLDQLDAKIQVDALQK